MARTAAAKKPTTVADRRRAIRGSKEPASGPSLRKTAKAEIDLTTASARKALTSLYPRPENDTLIAATPAIERAALDYITARDEASLANERKEIAGNVLCNAIARNRGALGDGWKAEWDMSKGAVDWTKLAKDLGIADDVIVKYRKPESRGLTVREIADEG